MDLKGKTVAVTGAARGIGRALAEGFAAAGAEVALIDMPDVDMSQALAACAAQGVRSRSYGANVANEEQVGATFDRIVGDFGRFDGIVNNAGIIRDALLLKVRDGAIAGR